MYFHILYGVTEEHMEVQEETVSALLYKFFIHPVIVYYG